MVLCEKAYHCVLLHMYPDVEFCSGGGKKKNKIHYSLSSSQDIVSVQFVPSLFPRQHLREEMAE